MVSCTMLVLGAMLGALCMFSVRVPLSVLPCLKRVFRAHEIANTQANAHWTDLCVKNMHPQNSCHDMYVLLAAAGAGIEGTTYQLPSDGDGPQVLTTNSFGSIIDETTQSGQTIIVEFFAPWCGHCKKLAPVWTKFADDVALDPKHSNTLKVAQVDALQTQRFVGSKV